MKLDSKANRREWLLLAVILAVACATSYIFIGNMMVCQKKPVLIGDMMLPNTSDILLHTIWADDYLDGTMAVSYPGYYLVYGFFSRLCGLSQVHAAAVSMGLFTVMTGLAVYIISGYVLGWQNSGKARCMIVLYMLYFGPLYLGGENYYIGPGSFNSWHNPTNSGVKFWALISFFLFLYVYRMKDSDTLSVGGKQLKRVHLYGILVVLTCCSLIFKPSFFQVFAPCLAIIYGVDFLLKKRSFKSCLLDAMMFLPAIALIFYQMFAEMGGEEAGGGIFISFAQGWSYHTDSVFRSIMTNAIFLLFVCVFCEKNLLKNKTLLYSALFYIVGVAEGLFLCESGLRMTHGNLLWGNEIGIGIGYMGAVLCFVQYMDRTKNHPTVGQKAVRYVGNALMAAQFLLGVWYIVECILLELEYF